MISQHHQVSLLENQVTNAPELQDVECGCRDRDPEIEVPPLRKDGEDVKQVEIWLRRAGEKVFLYEMDLAEFEKALHGEVWTRRSDGRLVFMDRAELAAYYSVDTYGWGDASRDRVPGNEDGQSETCEVAP